MLNLELIKIKNLEIKYKRREIYRKIFQKLCDTINHAAEQGNKYCLFQVPEFFFDEISYPLSECIEYLNNKLLKFKNDKFITEIIFYAPNVYFIQWKI
jgi:hypothetical protein